MKDKSGKEISENLRNDAKNIRLVMADVDGTLLTNDQVVDPETIKAISRLRESGILFGLCTGRELKSVLDSLSAWGIEGLVDAVVGSGGAEIADLTLDHSVKQYPLSGDLIKKVMRHYASLPVNFVIPEDGLLYTFKDDELIKTLSEGDQIPYKVVDPDAFLENEHLKVMLTFRPDLMPAIKEHSKSFHSPDFIGAPLVTASILFEYMDPRVSKPAGLLQLLNWHGWTEKNLCSFGDEDNDFPMTQMAGIGVVMENGSQKTKSAADYITDDNNHSGIATFINEFLV
ncbi:Cof-type HAD-IIB family hydrolase [Allobaculum sp. JKK-2023]|uniref:Cof-type HAD-IIB family hydrolase n=1 Tax=Allobaculum sp. JKK-2023 TaxID=3108943 RepID=UPI002B061F3E|nr:Cof-type HAD-IIB family hydrolase [Allobaculum sp. JKK-2023]